MFYHLITPINSRTLVLFFCTNNDGISCYFRREIDIACSILGKEFMREKTGSGKCLMGTPKKQTKSYELFMVLDHTIRFWSRVWFPSEMVFLKIHFYGTLSVDVCFSVFPKYTLLTKFSGIVFTNVFHQIYIRFC